MNGQSLARLCAMLVAPVLLQCSGAIVDLGGSSAGATSGDAGADDPGPPLITKASKVDLLLAVDNSSSMADKSELLARSLRPLLERVATVGDVHLGVVTSSLGSMGGDICDPINPENDRRAHLQTRDGNGNVIVPNGVLAFDPSTGIDAFASKAEALVRGVGQSGCGIEAQLESVYRFLVQPDPWDRVSLDGANQATLGESIDIEVLKQRAAFLRPDSLLVVLMLTDEDDSAVDPRSVGGQGWAFSAKNFPGSKVFRETSGQGTTAARATTRCEVEPGHEECTSCGFQSLCDPRLTSCQKIKQDPNCRTSGQPGAQGEGLDGYYAPLEDALNVRAHRMKERFGVDPQFPIARYVEGFTSFKVPDRKAEHAEALGPGGLREIAAYTHVRKCRNPIFAASLAHEPGDELCDRPRGPRSPELVLFGLIAGVPRPLVEAGEPNWTAMVGANPDAYDFSGQDPHMVPSVVARVGLPGPSSTVGDNGPDPVHGREYNTQKADLQYACTFELPTPRQCAPDVASCDCATGRSDNPPLCGTVPGQQIRGKAYPSLRELRVARGLGGRAVVGSICAESPSVAYAPFMQRLGDRIAARLAR